MLLEVDGVQGKRLMRLREVLIVPNIKVNMFSLQRVIDIGYIPVFEEKAGKCLIKKPIDGEGLVQVATMTVKTGRLTLDCRVVDAYKEGPSRPTVDAYTAKGVLTVDLLHRRLGHSGNDALQKLLRGNSVRGADRSRSVNCCRAAFANLGNWFRNRIRLSVSTGKEPSCWIWSSLTWRDRTDLRPLAESDMIWSLSTRILRDLS